MKPKVIQTLLGPDWEVDQKSGDAQTHHELQPSWPMQLQGLFIAGADAQTVVVDISVGNHCLLSGLVPAGFFSTRGRSFDELRELTERGELGEHEVSIQAPGVVQLGQRVRLTVKGKMSGFCFWGLRLAGDLPQRWHCQKLEEGDGIAVSLYETNLEGEHEFYKVQAPTLESAEQLTSIFWKGSHRRL